MTEPHPLTAALQRGDRRALARAITVIEAGGPAAAAVRRDLPAGPDRADIIGFTGPPGVGKSTLIDRLIDVFKERTGGVGVLAVDPTSAVHGGAILGDRIRWMRHSASPKVVLRSMASRGSLGGLSAATAGVVQLLGAAGLRPILLETVGLGQVGADVAALAGIVVALTAPGTGDDIQLLKAGNFDFADIVVLNKADLPAAPAFAAALRAELAHRGTMLLEVSAQDGAGVDALVEAIEGLRAARRAGPADGGAAAPTGAAAAESDIVERSLALLRPWLRREVAGRAPEASADEAARRLVARCVPAYRNGAPRES